MIEIDENKIKIITILTTTLSIILIIGIILSTFQLINLEQQNTQLTIQNQQQTIEIEKRQAELNQLINQKYDFEKQMNEKETELTNTEQELETLKDFYVPVHKLMVNCFYATTAYYDWEGFENHFLELGNVELIADQYIIDCYNYEDYLNWTKSWDIREKYDSQVID